VKITVPTTAVASSYMALHPVQALAGDDTQGTTPDEWRQKIQGGVSREGARATRFLTCSLPLFLRIVECNWPKQAEAEETALST
jgi:hypothetical protein